MRVTPVLNNPVLLYRSDPGEPAFRTSARATESAFVVMAQERRNLNRMKWEALEQGREIVYANISYKLEEAGSFLAVRAGRSEVWSREAQSRNAAKLILTGRLNGGTKDTEEADGTEGTQGTEDTEGTGQNKENGDATGAREIERLQNRAVDLERELQAVQVEAEAAETPEEAEAAQREMARVEAKLAEVERELARKEAEEQRRQIERQMEQLQNTVAGAIQGNLALVGKLIGMRYGGGAPQAEDGLNLLA